MGTFADESALTRTDLLPEDLLELMYHCQGIVNAFEEGQLTEADGDSFLAAIALWSAADLPWTHVVRHRASWHIRLTDDVSAVLWPLRKNMWRCLVNIDSEIERPLQTLAAVMSLALDDGLAADEVVSLLTDWPEIARRVAAKADAAPEEETDGR